MAEVRAAFHPDDVAIVLGTRPEAIKLLGLTRLLGDRARLIHTGQHYDEGMWAKVIGDLPGMAVDHHVRVGGLTRGEQIGSGTSALTRHLIEHPARALVVQGDTNSTVAGALAASSVGIPVVHVEAGLRCHDRAMPEEVNRVVVDAIADLCCAPTPENAAQLAREGIVGRRVAVTGNTLAEALSVLLPGEAERTAIVRAYGLRPGDYVLVTMHRAANVDDPERLRELLSALADLARLACVVLPLHPRTATAAERFELTHLLADVLVLPPLGPRHFVSLEAQALLLLSDSGGVQEEAALLRRPLLVLRDSTERPELLKGWCRLLGSAAVGPAVATAYADAAAWAESLTWRGSAYCEDAPSRVILDEIDHRWPAREARAAEPTPTAAGDAALAAASEDPAPTTPEPALS